MEKIKGSVLSVALQQSPATAAVVLPEAVPLEYLRPLPPAIDRVDKRMVLAALKEGVAVPGCELAEGGKHVRIR